MLKKKLEMVAKMIVSAEKQFGQGALMQLSETPLRPKVEVLPTGSLGLDVALGVGGWPKGRLVEVYGPESSGKSTLALEAVRACQEGGGIAAYIDAEHALDLVYARNLGVKVEEMLLSQPDTGEQGLDIVDLIVRSGAVDLIVVDSVAALIPKAELEGDMGDVHMGLQARLMSQALRKLVGSIAKTSTTVLFLNQIRHKIGVMFGSPETTPGGNALKFFASVRVDLRRVGGLKEGNQMVGHRVRAKVVKNKVAAPFQEAEFEIRYGTGISNLAEVLDWGVEYDLIEKSGSWYSYNHSILGQGRERACHNLEQQPELLSTLQQQLHAHIPALQMEAPVTTEKVPDVAEPSPEQPKKEAKSSKRGTSKGKKARNQQAAKTQN
ncbi:MAG: recombinase RecA [Deltaproteobacteria bacterium]|nr:MAG: recombinase RecA [Deltaproteobacteria bacterium]